MDEIVKYLEASIVDELFSKSEKKSLKTLVAELGLDRDGLNFLRSKVYEIAGSRVNETNYAFIIDWIRHASNALLPAQEDDKSTAFFSPGEACRKVIIQQIASALKRIHFCVFTISDDAISNSILLTHQKGVPIQIITDNDKSTDVGSDIDRLAREGVHVRVDRSSNHMHHKFMVADGLHVITGSYNWTLSAAKYNHENILLTREPGVVKSFLKQFDLLWPQMEALKYS